MAIIKMTREQFEKKYGYPPPVQSVADITAKKPQTPAQPQSLGSRIGADLKKRGQTMSAMIKGEGEYAQQGALRRSTGAVAEGFGAPINAAYQALPEGARTGLSKTGEIIGKGIGAVTDTVSDNPALQDWVMKYPEATKDLEEVLGTLSNTGRIAGDILTIGGAAAVAKKGVDVASKVGQQGVAAIKQAPATISKYVPKVKEAMGPKARTPVEATKQIFQGRTKDVKAGVNTLKNIDTSGVKTYADLGSKIDEGVSGFAGKVDDVFAKDPKIYTLKELAVSGTTKTGQKLSVDYVSRAFKQLKELYQKTGDDIAAKNIDDLMVKASRTGLTRSEVNSLAREYGVLRSKGFSKLGEPLTSVSAESAKNVGAGLKAAARMSDDIGKEAAKFDSTISSMKTTQKLVQANIEAVSKLQQKIQARGLLEKVGYGAAKAADMLTGGSLRGIVGGLLPRGVGNKIMNALDLQEALARNLKVVNQALKTGSDAELIKLLQSIK